MCLRRKERDKGTKRRIMWKHVQLFIELENVLSASHAKRDKSFQVYTHGLFLLIHPSNQLVAIPV